MGHTISQTNLKIGQVNRQIYKVPNLHDARKYDDDIRQQLGRGGGQAISAAVGRHTYRRSRRVPRRPHRLNRKWRVEHDQCDVGTKLWPRATERPC